MVPAGYLDSDVGVEDRLRLTLDSASFFHCPFPRKKNPRNFLDFDSELTLTAVFVMDVKKNTLVEGAQKIPFTRLLGSETTSTPTADVVPLQKWDDQTREAVKQNILRNPSWWHAQKGDTPVLFRPKGALQHEASVILIEASHPAMKELYDQVLSILPEKPMNSQVFLTIADNSRPTPQLPHPDPPQEADRVICAREMKMTHDEAAALRRDVAQLSMKVFQFAAPVSLVRF